MQHALLPHRAVLAVSGEDARDFLQGLITNDIRKVAPGTAIFAALLSPQGKFLYDFFISAHDGRLLLETEAARLPELKKRLSMYKLRSKVELAECPEWQAAAGWGEMSEVTAANAYVDPRLPGLGIRLLVKDDSGVNAEAADYDRHRLALGVPDGYRDLVVDRSILLEYGYDELNGVDFAKGCYVGQEVTARSKHRAAIRRFLHQVRGEDELPPPGSKILAGDKEIGEMRSHAGPIGLALLSAEETVKAGGGVLCEGISLKAVLPAWRRTPLVGIDT